VAVSLWATLRPGPFIAGSLVTLCLLSLALQLLTTTPLGPDLHELLGLLALLSALVGASACRRLTRRCS
jgi:hypothetical protein